MLVDRRAKLPLDKSPGRKKKVTEKLTMVLKKVFEKVNVIKNQSVADGYMQLINQVNSMRLDF